MKLCVIVFRRGEKSEGNFRELIPSLWVGKPQDKTAGA